MATQASQLQNYERVSMMSPLLSAEFLLEQHAAQPPVLTSPRPFDVQSMTTIDLRATFLIEKLFDGDKLSWTFTDLDRLAVGGVAPASSVKLENFKQTGADFFLQRREMGIINVGAPGVITVDGKRYELANLDCLYISMGSREVGFE